MARKSNRKPKRGNNSPPPQAQQNVPSPSPCLDNLRGSGGLTTKEELKLQERAIRNGWNVPAHIMDEALFVTRKNIHSSSERISNIAVKNIIAMVGQDQKERLLAKHVPTVDQQDERINRVLDQLDAMDETLPLVPNEEMNDDTCGLT